MAEDDEDLTRWPEDDDPESLGGEDDLGVQAWEGVLAFPNDIEYPGVA
jgi:hypothetical protein